MAEGRSRFVVLEVFMMEEFLIGWRRLLGSVLKLPEVDQHTPSARYPRQDYSQGFLR